MKVFVSSLITGMEPIRAAAREAITTLRHEPVMAEDFGAQPNSPQVTCLSGVRQSDLVILIFGERYGAEQEPSGLSATHEEYREAKTSKPVIAFVQEPATFEPRQKAFVEEVQGWSGGLFRGGFRDAVELQRLVTRALYDYALTNAVGAVDEPGMLVRAAGLIPAPRGGMSSGTPTLTVAAAGGPKQKILRPVEMEDQVLWEAMHQAAMFGETRVFDQTQGVRKSLDGSALVLSQERGGSVRLDEEGDLTVASAIERQGDRMSPTSLVEEEIRRLLTSALGYVSWTLDRVDPTQRLTHVAVAARIIGGEYMPWMTQAELAASNGSYSMGNGSAERPVVQVVTPRAALRLDRNRLVDDLLVPLRRQWKPSGRR